MLAAICGNVFPPPVGMLRTTWSPAKIVLMSSTYTFHNSKLCEFCIFMVSFINWDPPNRVSLYINSYLVQLCETQKISLNNRLFKNMPHVGSFWQFVICCICVFVYFVFVMLYMRVWHMGTSLLIPFYNHLFKNIPHVGSFRHFVIFCICVFVYVCICIFVFVH